MNRIKEFFLKLFGRNKKMLNENNNTLMNSSTFEKVDSKTSLDEMRGKYSNESYKEKIELFNLLVTGKKEVEQLTEVQKNDISKILEQKINEEERKISFLQKKISQIK